jgi:putative PIN family toxin of toxin-antitoxin system
VRAVLDPNVIISGLLAPSGGPAHVLQVWELGDFELVVSRALLEELARAFTYPKLVSRISETDAEAVMRWLRGSATMAHDPNLPPTVNSADPGDDYLIALAEAERAALVSGDRHLLDLAGEIPVFSPRQFLDLLAAPGAETPSA